MNGPNKKTLGTKAIRPQSFNRPAGHSPHFKPVVAQVKTHVSAQSVKGPVAPPVYRPQMVPKALQLKMANGVANSGLLVAPTVYRPSPRSPTAQPKLILSSRHPAELENSKRNPVSPLGYRLQQTPRVLQQKELHRSDGGIPIQTPRGVSNSCAVQLAAKERKNRSLTPEDEMGPPAPRRERYRTPASERPRSRSRDYRPGTPDGEKKKFGDAPRPRRGSFQMDDDAKQGPLGKGHRVRQFTKAILQSGVDISGEKNPISQRAEERKQAWNEGGPSGKIVKPIARARGPKPTPPAGKFLMFGARGELAWAVTADTNLMRGDEYIYHRAAHGGGSDYKFQNGRGEYRCAKCKKFFPRKADRQRGEAYITVDHNPPMSRRLDSLKYLATFCDGENVWEGQREETCKRDYNDPAKLQMMCNSDNSSKGGQKGYAQFEPKIIGTHETNCDFDEGHSDVREVGIVKKKK